MTKMSITRALAELKNLDTRIKRAIAEGTFVTTTVGRNNMKKVATVNVSIPEMTARIDASHQKVRSLISNREKIKRAVVASNAATNVTIKDRVMTVAEAIELKSSIEYRETYVNAMRQQLTVHRTNIQTTNFGLDKTINESLNTIYGNDKGKVDETMHVAIAKPQLDQKEASLLDPSGVETLIEFESEYISAVKNELDFILSESNAMTQIEVDLTSV